MRVLIQWATATVSDWVEYNITSVSQIRALPKKPEPSDSPLIDDNLGWIAAINIQGVVFQGYDHIGFGITAVSGETALTVTCWNDDPGDFGPNERWGQVWTFLPLAPDPAFPLDPEDPIQQAWMDDNPSLWALHNGIPVRINTRQTCVWYGESQSTPVLAGVPNVQPYSQLSFPHKNYTIHGTWASDEHWAALQNAQSPKRWEGWA